MSNTKTPSTMGTDLASIVLALQQKVTLMEHKALVNESVFTEAFETQDAVMHVMQRAMSDLMNGSVISTLVDGSMRINFSEYFANYVACMGMSAFVARAFPDQPDTAQEEPYEEGAFIFGGDVGR